MLAVNHFSVPVVGVTFVPDYPFNLLDLAVLVGTADEPLRVVLIRNPNNPHDANAIEVHVPALGESGMIGHLPANLASRLAPLIDAGETWSGHVEQVLINQDHPDRPGVVITVKKIETEAGRG